MRWIFLCCFCVWFQVHFVFSFYQKQKKLQIWHKIESSVIKINTVSRAVRRNLRAFIVATETNSHVWSANRELKWEKKNFYLFSHRLFIEGIYQNWQKEEIKSCASVLCVRKERNCHGKMNFHLVHLSSISNEFHPEKSDIFIHLDTRQFWTWHANYDLLVRQRPSRQFFHSHCWTSMIKM